MAPLQFLFVGIILQSAGASRTTLDKLVEIVRVKQHNTLNQSANAQADNEGWTKVGCRCRDYDWKEDKTCSDTTTRSFLNLHVRHVAKSDSAFGICCKMYTSQANLKYKLAVDKYNNPEQLDLLEYGDRFDPSDPDALCKKQFINTRLREDPDVQRVWNIGPCCHMFGGSVNARITTMKQIRKDTLDPKAPGGVRFEWAPEMHADLDMIGVTYFSNGTKAGAKEAQAYVAEILKTKSELTTSTDLICENFHAFARMDGEGTEEDGFLRENCFLDR
eukprot:gnl/TRDRNA2_/TRDRNA2_178008_c1_seq10.p1 gnl/TRDRNA2_/TRDRNA2_178008_c1~~gnl/TRDRNA2_/TRDRNA2_178008_c1_seq10.p1  ORF type:complete len:275 (+),score=39.13 gnl/TRDRNA2_/TRDRNA2_178008_c1_seq10:93-917(+)